MKFKRELLIGIFAVAVIGVSWWGIKWLGGQNVFLTSNIYYARYDDVTGLQESSRVNLLGVEVGNVRSIELQDDGVLVEIAVEDRYAHMIPSNSVAEIGSTGLMGGMEIFIIKGDAEDAMPDGGMFEGRMRPDMLASLSDKGTELLEGLNQTVDGVNSLLNDNSENITMLIANLESMSASVDGIINSSADDIETAMDDLSTFTSTLAENTSRIETLLTNIETFSGDLAESDIFTELETTVSSLNGVLASIENGEGSVGMLLNDTQLYDSLTSAGDNLSLLLEDLKANPMRYVHFSLFGSSDEKAERKAEREARRAARRGETVVEEPVEQTVEE